MNHASAPDWIGLRSPPVATRFALLGVVFAIVLMLDGPGAASSGITTRGLYGTLAVGFLANLLVEPLRRRANHSNALAAVPFCMDLGIVTALVHFSGRSESIFVFLYALVVVYGATVFERRLALLGALLAATAYAGVLLEDHWIHWFGGDRGDPSLLPALFARAGVNAGGLLLVAFLASALSGELHRAGRALDESNRDLGQLRRLHVRIVESLTSGLLTTDLQHTVTSFNAEAERITGISGEQALGRPLEELIPGAEVLLREDRGVAGRTARERLAFRRPGGENLHLGLAASILKDAESVGSGHVLIFQNVTHVVEMEQELRRSERLAGVGQLAAHIAHEVRNPLAAMSGAIQMMSADSMQGGPAPETSGEEQQRLMGIVLREIDRLNVLITDFLQFARPTPIKPETIALQTVVREILDVFGSGESGRVRVVEEIDPDLAIRADAGQLRQMFWNLIRNADQAMPDGGRLTITGKPRDPSSQEGSSKNRSEEREEGDVWAEILVSDTGSGISPDVIERVFDPFFTTKDEGTGLGLAAVHHIVHTNEGRLQVESAAGFGTIFRIRLPRVEGT